MNGVALTTEMSTHFSARSLLPCIWEFSGVLMTQSFGGLDLLPAELGTWKIRRRFTYTCVDRQERDTGFVGINEQTTLTWLWKQHMTTELVQNTAQRRGS